MAFFLPKILAKIDSNPKENGDFAKFQLLDIKKIKYITTK